MQAETKENILKFLPIILFGLSLLCVVLFCTVAFPYHRLNRFPALGQTIIALTCVFLIGSLVSAIIYIVKYKRYLLFTIVGSISIVVILIIRFVVFPVSVLFFGRSYSEYDLFNKNWGTPQLMLKNVTGEKCYINTHDYRMTLNKERVFDTDNRLYSIIYNASYKQIETINSKDEKLDYIQYNVPFDDAMYFRIFSNGKAYIACFPDLSAAQYNYFKYSDETTQTIFTTAYQIISERDINPE